jgi:hypothetical protein
MEIQEPYTVELTAEDLKMDPEIETGAELVVH